MDIGSAEWNAVIREGAVNLNIPVSEKQAGQFAAHALELVRWNRRINLTALTDPLGMAVKHYLDSIAAVPYIKPQATLLDVGSGGGFPGIPLKIMQPGLMVTLLEARRKRVNFLKHVTRSMALTGIDILHERLESVTDKAPLDDGYDVIVSRAYSDLGQFVTNAWPLVKPGGCLLAYKGKTGGGLNAEIAEGRKNAEELVSTTRLHMETRAFALPWFQTERTLIIVTAESAVNRNSERIPRSLLRSQRANRK